MARCPSPIRLKDKPFDFPCGKCYDCKARRASGWAFRLQQEDKDAETSIFLTLTYSPEHVPVSNKGRLTLQRSDVQNFMKRLRKRHIGPKIKYYAVGEYGSNTERPHYHLIIFNAKHDDIIASWQLGEVYFGNVSGASVGYVLKYLTKPSKIPKYPGDDRVKEFQLTSKGIGLSYITDNTFNWHRAYPLDRMFIPLRDGRKIAVPRYLRTRLFTSKETEALAERLKAQELTPKALHDWSNRKKRHDDWRKVVGKDHANKIKDKRGTF